MTTSINFCHRSVVGMNSVLDLLLLDLEGKAANELVRLCRKELTALEKLLSRFDPDSETYRLNQAAVVNWIPVSDELWSVLLQCEQYRKCSRGYFNVGLGYFKHNAAPANHLVNPEIQFEAKTKSVLFGNRFTSLDFGAIGKGLFLQKLDELFTRFQVENAFASFGGSSVLTRGKHPSGDYWPLSFRMDEAHPQVFKLNKHAASISGAQTVGAEAEHIVDPKRMEFRKEPRVVFAKGDCPVEAEVLSTALVAASPDDFDALSRGFNPEQVAVFRQTKSNKLLLEYEYTRPN